MAKWEEYYDLLPIYAHFIHITDIVDIGQIQRTIGIRVKERIKATLVFNTFVCLINTRCIMHNGTTQDMVIDKI